MMNVINAETPRSCVDKTSLEAMGDQIARDYAMLRYDSDPTMNEITLEILTAELQAHFKAAIQNTAYADALNTLENISGNIKNLQSQLENAQRDISPL